MFESDIELKLADCPEQVAAIVKKTIQKVYPHYYPSGAVQFFLDLHSAVRIKEVMSSEKIYLVTQQGNIIGTGSIRKNEICRLFRMKKWKQKTEISSAIIRWKKSRQMKCWRKVSTARASMMRSRGI